MTPIESALEARFFAPLKRPRTRKAGVELELPICNLDPARPVDFVAVHAVTEAFLPACGFEARSMDAALAFAAFHAGLMEKLPELAALLENDESLHGRGYNVGELREICNRREWPLFIDRAALSARLLEILDLASVGCALRGKNEAALLAPLYRRAETLTSPAREYADGLARGESVETWIDRFGSGGA